LLRLSVSTPHSQVFWRDRRLLRFICFETENAENAKCENENDRPSFAAVCEVCLSLRILQNKPHKFPVKDLYQNFDTLTNCIFISSSSSSSHGIFKVAKQQRHREDHYI